MRSTSTARSASGRHAGRLALVLVLVVALLAAELTVAAMTGSLALLSDAGHLATDVVGLSLALAAVLTAQARPAGGRRTFGWYRLEILAALTNALLLTAVAVAVTVGAIRRIGAPVEVEPRPLMVVALVALAVNLFSAWLLRRGAAESLNLEGARLEVLADAVGSIGVLVTALVIELTGWTPIDSIVGLAIAAWLLPRALRLGGKSLRVLLEHAPKAVDLARLRTEILALPEVQGVHDLHVWTLTSGMDVASVHVQVGTADQQHAIQHAVRDVFVEHAALDHVTVQVELADDPNCCEGHPGDW